MTVVLCGLGVLCAIPFVAGIASLACCFELGAMGAAARAEDRWMIFLVVVCGLRVLCAKPSVTASHA